MRKTLVRYTNGNYKVVLLSDGTKIRFGKDGGEFDAAFPESVDLNITDWCDVGCNFCYRGCTTNGVHHPFDEVELTRLAFPYGMEIALGGGSPIRHPDLERYCAFFRSIGCVPSITVHRSSIMDMRMDGDLNRLMELQTMERIHGVGISTTTYDESLSRSVQEYLDHGVIHLIVGLVAVDDVYLWIRDGIPVLFLGYKNMGRGALSSEGEEAEISDCIEGLMRLVVELTCGKGPLMHELESRYGPISGKPTMSFDNLALKQMKLREILPEEKWNEMYMGDDGVDGELTSASMYLDLVSMVYARNSVDGRTRPVDGKTITEMFTDLKERA